jgi:predicted transposase/invertase (TIGR01784 family)
MSGQPSPSPHDAVFRGVLGVPANAASQLRAVLPGALAARLDLDQLTQVPDSFVDEALRWRYSDLLFTVPLDGRQAFVYVLIEHQSRADPLMAFRMLRYVIRIWDHYLRGHRQARQLPAVIPLVVHHGRRPWASPVQLLDLLDLDPDTASAAWRYLPKFEFLLDDLTGLSDEELRDRPLTAPARITLLLLKIAADNPRLLSDLRPWADQLRAILGEPGGFDMLIALLTYIELVGEVPAGELDDLAASLGPEAKEAYVTTADMLRAEGEARGRAEMLVQQLTLKFGPIPEAVSEAVHAASRDQIQTWAARVLTADALDQVLS